MSVDSKTVDRIAALSKLEFNESEKNEIVNDLNRMLAFAEQLKEVNTEGIEPLIYLLEEEPNLRKDEVIQVITQKEALKNAPEKDTDFIKVPKVLSK